MIAAPAGLNGAAIDGGLFTDITEAARQAPPTVDSAVAAWSTFGVVLFALLLAAAWWRARRAPARAMAQVLATPAVVTVVFGVDMLIKQLAREPRPCRAIPRSFVLEGCPTGADWSFPSNHTVVVFAALAALWLVDRRLGAIALPLAAAMAVSRVWVGAHYPHDVLAGAVVGLLLGLPLTAGAARLAPAVERARAGRLRRLVARADSSSVLS